MTRRRPSMLAPLLAAMLIAAAPASAQAPRPTLTFDRACYGEQELIGFSGQQYTPGGEVALFFAANGRFGKFALNADPSGAIGGQIKSPDPDDFLSDDEERTEIGVTANDQPRMQNGTLESDPEATVGIAAFTLTRTYARLTPTKPRPGRRLTITVRGMADSTGQPLYLHYRRGSKSLKVTRLGRLAGPCGDLRKRISRAFPLRAVPAGRYALYVSTSRRNPTDGAYFRFGVRVGRGAATSALASPARAALHRPDSHR